MSRAAAHPDQLTDTDLGMANVILTNGARLYVDHAHPEYSSPEVTCAAGRGALRQGWRGRDGDRRPARQHVLGGARSGSTRTTPTARAPRTAPTRTTCCSAAHRSTGSSRQFTAFLVSRQVITGAGRVGIGQSSQTPGFQISQRADFFEAEVGLETTLNRPIINTRDEPHADAT